MHQDKYIQTFHKITCTLRNVKFSSNKIFWGTGAKFYLVTRFFKCWGLINFIQQILTNDANKLNLAPVLINIFPDENLTFFIVYNTINLARWVIRFMGLDFLCILKVLDFIDYIFVPRFSDFIALQLRIVERTFRFTIISFILLFFRLTADLEITRQVKIPPSLHLKK